MIQFANEIYKKYKNALNKLLRCAKKKYFESKLKEACGNPAETWNIIKNVISSKDSVSPDEIITRDGSASSGPEDVCNAMSEHFATVGARLFRTPTASEVDVPLETFMGIHVDVSMYLRPVIQDEIRKIIFERKSTSAGSDYINLLVLKTAFPIISKIFTSLINACLLQEKFPNCLKIARITPVFTGGNKMIRGNIHQFRYYLLFQCSWKMS